VRAENLDSAILVMKAAENRSRCDGAEPLNCPMNGSVLAQSSMSPRFIIVGGKLAKDPAQMGLTEHNQMVETFPSDRADQSLRVPPAPNSLAAATGKGAFWHKQETTSGTMRSSWRQGGRHDGSGLPPA
jgi:hypothetical protein